MIGPSGGQVAATNASGVQFELDVPEHALAGNETITLTPAGFGVVMTPASLGFIRPADLQVDDGSLPDLGRAVAFAARADGSEAHLVPFTVDDQAAHIALQRLGFAGTSVAGADEVQAQLGFVPTGEQEWAQQRIAGAQALVLRSAWSQAQADAETASALDRWWSASLAPRLGSAAGFDDLAIEFLAYHALVPAAVGLQTAIGEAIGTAYASCLAGDASQAGRLLLLLRINDVLAYERVDDEPLRRCARFDRRPHVQYTYAQDPYVAGSVHSSGREFSYTTQVSGLRVGYSPGDLELHAVTPLQRQRLAGPGRGRAVRRATRRGETLRSGRSARPRSRSTCRRRTSVTRASGLACA